MPADINDHNQLPAVLVTQATPWGYVQGGVLCSAVGNAAKGIIAGSAYMATPIGPQQAGANYQLSTQDNNTPGGISNYGWQQVAAVATAFPPQNATAGASPGVIGSGVLNIVAPQVSVSGDGRAYDLPILATVAAQITTQVNPYPGDLSSNSVVAQQQVAVIGPVYYSPGNVQNAVGPANSNLTTGGGP